MQGPVPWFTAPWSFLAVWWGLGLGSDLWESRSYRSTLMSLETKSQGQHCHLPPAAPLSRQGGPGPWRSPLSTRHPCGSQGHPPSRPRGTGYRRPSGAGSQPRRESIDWLPQCDPGTWPPLQPTGPWGGPGRSGLLGPAPRGPEAGHSHLPERGLPAPGRGAGGASYTSVSTRRRSILRMLPSTATRLVMLRAKSSGNQPVSPSRSLSP